MEDGNEMGNRQEISLSHSSRALLEIKIVQS